MNVCMHFNHKHKQTKKTSIRYKNSDQITKIDRIINDSNIYYYGFFNNDSQTSVMITYVTEGNYKNSVYLMYKDKKTSNLNNADVKFFQQLDPIFKNTKTSQEIVKIFDNEYVARSKNEPKIVWE